MKDMSLTSHDLDAIKTIVEDAIEDSKRHTAAGFKEVNGKADKLILAVDRIDRVQQAELRRNDHQDADIKRIRKALHAA